MKLISVCACALGALSVGVAASPFSNAWNSAHTDVVASKGVASVPKDLACSEPSTKLAVRGGGLFGNALDPLEQGKVMDFKTALKYKLGLLGETVLLLGILNASKELHWQVKDPTLKNAVDLGTWALVIFGSDGIVGLLHKITDKFGWTRPRQTLKESQDTWYQHIDKPRWTPPNLAFPLTWIPLKILQTFAARIVWVACNRNILSAPVALFVLHLALGDSWNTAFFRNHYIAGGLSIIYQFFAVLLVSTYQFYQTDRLAGVMLIPTCLWMVIASSLNLSIYRKNN